MKAPIFWHKRNIISYLLLPLSWVYLLISHLKKKLSCPTKIKTPIICIGNLIAGGAGKTPIAIEVGLIFKELGVDFAYLSAGYSGKIKDFTLVNNLDHDASMVGDEPLLLSEISSTFISKNRLKGALEISKMPDKKAIIMDDGFQNGSIKKDLSILIIDGKYGFGNGFAIPAGPLRENIANGIKRSDLVIIIGEDKFNISNNLCYNKKVINAKIKSTNAINFSGKSIIAFCGIGRPEKFFESLQQENINTLHKFSYPDHYHYQESEIDKMLDLANKNNTILLTTKKDWVRLSPKHQKQTQYLDIAIEFKNKNYLKDTINKCIK